MTQALSSSPKNKHKTHKRINSSGFLAQRDEEVDMWRQEPGYNEIEYSRLMENSNDEDDQYTVNTFTAATHLLEKRREMLEVHNILKSKREEFQERLKSIKDKEKALSQKRNELTDNIIELDKFIGDNEIKRTRADQKQKKEEEDRFRNEEIIKELRNEIELLKVEKKEKEELLARDSKYHNYLKSVVALKGDGDPENVGALMKRYENLEKYRNHLAEQIEKKQNELNEKKKKQKEDNENWKKSTIELNHIISTQGKTLERLQKENNTNRKRAETSQSCINDLQVTLGKIEMACQNLYYRITDPQHGSHITRVQQNPDEFKMLKIVGDCIADFSFVLAQFKLLPEQEKQKVMKNPG